jgi:hypothetical protein
MEDFSQATHSFIDCQNVCTCLGWGNLKEGVHLANNNNNISIELKEIRWGSMDWMHAGWDNDW